VVPETRMFAPASIALLQLSKFIPPSISISKSKKLFKSDAYVNGSIKILFNDLEPSMIELK